MSQDLDLSLRTLWAAAPASIVQWATGRPHIRLLQRGETQLPSLRRDLDTVALVEDPEHGPFVFHLEGEGSMEAEDLRRFAAYAALLHQNYALPVQTFVLLMERHSRLPDDHRVFWGDRLLSFHAVKLLRLYEVPAAELLEHPALRPLVALGQNPQVHHLAEARRRIEQERPENWRDMLAVLYVTTAKVFSPGVYRAILFSEAIMESPVFLEILKMGEERGIERGIERGLERGLEQGREQGREQLAREQLRITLATRFPGLEQRIPCESLSTDQAVALFRVALTASSEQQVLEALSG